MVFKRYIKRGGKSYGPYFYESKRVDGRIKSIYVGSKKNKELLKKYGAKKKKQPLKKTSLTHKKISLIHKKTQSKKISRKKTSTPKKAPSKKKLRTRPPQKKHPLSLKNATVQELMRRFNELLENLNNTVPVGALGESIESYEEIVHIYNHIKRKLPYDDSIKLYETIKKVYEDIRTLQQEELYF